MQRKQNNLLVAGKRWAMLFAAAWLFIVLAGALDGYFAWRFQADFQAWETNPWARWLARNCSMGALLCFKALGLVFGGAVAVGCRRLKHRLAMPMTLVIFGAYFFLSLHYAAGFLAAPAAPAEVVALATPLARP